jgi:CRISPR-associated protein Cas5d
MAHLSYSVKMEISGNTAMWTRPDTGDCPVSYPAPTYSAVKAIFESILWGPAVEINPVKTEICAPIQFHSYYTNYGGPLRKSVNIKKGDSYQLCATVLVDVCYRLYAEVIPFREKDKLPQKAKEWDKATTSPGHAYQAMFNRRSNAGSATPCRVWAGENSHPHILAYSAIIPVLWRNYRQ